MRKLLIVAAAIGACMVFGTKDDTPRAAPQKAPVTKYRLVHAIGDSERISDEAMDIRTCQERRDDLKRVAMLVGSGGSITCLRDEDLWG